MLAGGTLGDKFGRRGTLIAGLTLLALSSVGAALCTTTDSLVVARLVMEYRGADLPDHAGDHHRYLPGPEAARRSHRAVGRSPASASRSGQLGGALLEVFWWGSLFLALVPIALIAAVAAPLVIPPSSVDHGSRLDRGGLVLSVVMLGSLVYTIIEAPERGWTSAATLTGFGTALAAAIGFGWCRERRQADPLIDITLFANLRFSAASGAVTVAFFAPVRVHLPDHPVHAAAPGLRPAGHRVRILPVALSIAVGSVLGTRLAVSRVGTKIVVFVGLVMMAAAFAWINVIDLSVGYPEMAAQMVLLGAGLGLTTAPATDSIMGLCDPSRPVPVQRSTTQPVRWAEHPASR